MTESKHDKVKDIRHVIERRERKANAIREKLEQAHRELWKEAFDLVYEGVELGEVDEAAVNAIFARMQAELVTSVTELVPARNAVMDGWNELRKATGVD